MQVSDFDFELPASLIAQTPSAERGASRLLVLSRETGAIEHTVFSRLGDYLRPGDLLVLNDTRVYPARLLGRRVPSGGLVECLLLEEAGDPGAHAVDPSRPGVRFSALMHPGQKLKPGARVTFAREGVPLEGEVEGRHFHGRRTIRLWTDDATDVTAAIDRIGHIPLPPYIRRADTPDDRERYQTVYARARGSVAAPTAGLHFTAPLLDTLASRGVELASVTLHVGYGTFKPVRTERVDDHVVDPERFVVSSETADALTRARREHRRVIAVGTTTARALETLALDSEGHVQPAQGETTLFVRPGHTFRIVDGLITNFHLPRSSLLVLVSALAGRDAVLAAYRNAVQQGYRFYSYGDAMLVAPERTGDL